MEHHRNGESLSPSSAPISYVRRRAPTACRVCRQRKVKCDVATVGIPCLNCVRDSHSCEVFGRKRRTPPQPQTQSPTTGVRSTHLEDGNVASPVTQSRPPISTSNLSSATNSDTTLVVSRGTLFSPPANGKRDHGMRDELDGETAIEVDNDTMMDLDNDSRARGPDEYAIESLATSLMEANAEATTETFYVGDQQGIGYILDIVGEPSAVSQHYGLPYMANIHDLLPQDVAYLRFKGVFSIPSEPVCHALLTAYFHHVHPILPVVDAAAVLTTFRNGGAVALNVLLLWSMFSVAANYVDKAVVHQAGYQSHKEMKKSMFIRAKCVYDNGSEKDRISIIQSVSLLAFWYSDLGERTESWHWMGIAISLSQTLGLNRDPDRGQYNTRLSERQRQLWRRIWWSCFFRDRWLSLGMGRPMRINTRDCDVPMPSAEDLTDDFGDLPSSIRTKYIPADFEHLANHWLVLLRLSQALGTILSENYSPAGSLPSRCWIEATEQELVRCMVQTAELPANASPALCFYSYHLRLHLNAATIALWRPFSNRVATDVPSDQEGMWHELVHRKIRTAAANTNTVLDKVISEQLIGYIGPMTIPVLVPAMNSHLLESKSLDPLIRQSSLNKLNLYMMVLKRVQDIYSSATFIHGLFIQAIEKLTSPQYEITPHPHLSKHSSSSSDSANQVALLPMDSFWQFDDGMSEFWESLPNLSGQTADDAI